MFITKRSTFSEWWFSVTKLWFWKESLPPIEQAPEFMYFLWLTFESGFEAKYEKQSLQEAFLSFHGFLAYALTAQRKMHAVCSFDRFHPFRCLSWPLLTICTPFTHLPSILGCVSCSKKIFYMIWRNALFFIWKMLKSRTRTHFFPHLPQPLWKY